MKNRLKEKEVQQVVFKYLDAPGAKPSIGGAGPDIKLGDGRAIEVKGGRLRGRSFERTIRQLVEYAHDWSDIELALPITALTLRKIYTFYVIEEALKFLGIGKHKTIPVYLVARSDKDYSVLRFSSMKDLYDEVTSSIIKKYRPVYGEGKEKKMERIIPLYKIDEIIVEVLEERARSSMGKKVSLLSPSP